MTFWTRKLFSELQEDRKRVDILDKEVSELQEDRKREIARREKEEASKQSERNLVQCPPTLSAKQEPKCPQCQGSHYLDRCPIFLGRKEEDRLRIVRLHGHCVNCLKSRHFPKDCKKPRGCQECGNFHHTFLHGNWSRDRVVRKGRRPNERPSPPPWRTHVRGRNQRSFESSFQPILFKETKRDTTVSQSDQLPEIPIFEMDAVSELPEANENTIPTTIESSESTSRQSAVSALEGLDVGQATGGVFAELGEDFEIVREGSVKMMKSAYSTDHVQSILPNLSYNQAVRMKNARLKKYHVSLRTVPVLIRNSTTGKVTRIQALLDEGSSQTLLDHEVALDLFGNSRKGVETKLNLEGFKHDRFQGIGYLVPIEISGVGEHTFYNIHAITTERPAGQLTGVNWQELKQGWPYMSKIDFPKSKKETVKMIIGADYGYLMRSLQDVVHEVPSMRKLCPVARKPL